MWLAFIDPGQIGALPDLMLGALDIRDDGAVGRNVGLHLAQRFNCHRFPRDLGLRIRD